MNTPNKFKIGLAAFGIGIILFISFLLFLDKQPITICQNCEKSQLEPKAVLACYFFVKVPFSETRLPYSIVKKTLCRCKNCGNGAWIHRKEIEKELNYSNHWGTGRDFNCPFCNGIMKAYSHADRECAADWYYICNNCKQKLILVNCYDQPISWAESFFKDIDLK
jgi:hypothetical protein